MGHVDDGQLNALLDGELNGTDREAVEAHLAACAECRVRFEEAKAFLGQATDLLGALDVPAAGRRTPARPAIPAPPRPATPASTVAQTGKERAIDAGAPRVATTGKERAIEIPEPVTAKSRAIDVDITRKSAAIRPLFKKKGAPEEAAAETPTRRWQPTPLAWAAMLVLAVGAGWMANEVVHGGRAPQVATSAQTQHPTEVAANPATQAAGATPSAAAPHRATRIPLIKPRAMRGDKPPNSDEAAAHIPRDRPPGIRHTEPAANAPTTAEAAADLAAGRAAPTANAGAGVAQAPAPTAPPLAAPTTDAVAARTRTAQPPASAASAAPAGFQPVSMDEAVRRLSGSIRLIDGMDPLRVEAGPGSLVSGAAPARDVVRVTYADARLGSLTLDQQPPASGEAQESNNGLMRGDTLVTEQPDSTVRVRWVDGKGYWLSLTGHGAADEVRAFVERIR